jgi:hypothetical protein
MSFQRIVGLIQSALAPEGATVTESAMVTIDGFDREIDVLVEADLGMYRMKVAVEAKDHGRPLDVTAIETVLGKYAAASDSIRVNQVVLVSRSGFTAQAIKKAKDNQLLLLTLAEAEASKWETFVPTPFRKFPAIVSSPEIVDVTCEPPLPQDWRTLLPMIEVKHALTGKQVGSGTALLLASVKDRISTPAFQSNLKCELAAQNGSIIATFDIRCNHMTFAFGRDVISPKRLTVSVQFRADIPIQIQALEQTDAEGNTRVMYYGYGEWNGQKFRSLLPDRLEGGTGIMRVSERGAD